MKAKMIIATNYELAIRERDDALAILAEARAVFDLMLVGCSLQCFGDYQNGDGETIGPRMDALHAALRGQQAPIQSAEHVAYFYQASEFGPWIECGGNEPGCIRFISATKTNAVSPAHALTDAEREAARDALSAELGQAMDCTRVWSAWGVGTMSEDDFQLLADNDERLDDIIDAVFAAAHLARKG